MPAFSVQYIYIYIERERDRQTDRDREIIHRQAFTESVWPVLWRKGILDPDVLVVVCKLFVVKRLAFIPGQVQKSIQYTH